MPNKKISAFNVNTSPTGSDVLPIVNNDETKKIYLSGLTDYIGSITTSALTETVSGLTETIENLNVKHWREDETKIISARDTIVISGNYVLKNINLTIENSGNEIITNDDTFSEFGQLFIGGHLLLIDTNIINNGSISVAGGIIYSGSSTITGTGIIQ
jgi:hypothetical protein